MSYFKGEDGKDYKIFGESGVEKTAKEFNKEFLGSIPIHQDLRSSADKGEPLTHSYPDHEVSKLFKNIAEKIKQSFSLKLKEVINSFHSLWINQNFHELLFLL